MNTAQEAPNDHRVSPPPSSVENPAELNSADLPADQDNNRQFPASAYHVPPKRFAPRPNAYAYDDSFHRPPETEPLPDRCQFMFSDGRQCTMARSDIHPSLCFYHADREEQLFGDPSHRCETRKLDFPELYSACCDLSTAAGVNRALAQVFRLLAQRRISRQEAATFGHLAKLLLRTISLMAADSLGTPADAADPVIRPSGERHGHQELSHVNKVALAVAESDDVSSGVILSERSERRISPQSSSEQPLPPSRFNHATAPSPSPTPVNSSARPIAASPEPPAQRVAMSNSRKISTSATSVCNSPEISTSEIAGLNPIQNQHLDEKRSASEPCSSGRTASA